MPNIFLRSNFYYSKIYKILVIKKRKSAFKWVGFLVITIKFFMQMNLLFVLKIIKLFFRLSTSPLAFFTVMNPKVPTCWTCS